MSLFIGSNSSKYTESTESQLAETFELFIILNEGVDLKNLNKSQVEKLLDCSSCTILYTYKELGMLLIAPTPDAELSQLHRNANILNTFPNIKAQQTSSTNTSMDKYSPELHPHDPRKDKPLKTTSNPSGWAREMVNAPTSPTAPQGKNIKILIIDSGIDKNSEAFKHSEIIGKDFVEDENSKNAPYEYFDHDGHGTQVAGIIAGQSSYIKGIAPKVKLYIARACIKEDCSLSSVTYAINWGLENNVEIINMSLGWDLPTRSGDIVYKRLYNKGVTVVAAAGNDAESTFYQNGELSYPANYKETIAVGSVASDFQPSAFSQNGELLTLLAPGEQILSAAPKGTGRVSHLEIKVGNDITQTPNLRMEGSARNHTPVDAAIAWVNDIHNITENLSGKIALIARGTFHFKEMAEVVSNHGASALIVYDNLNDNQITLGRLNYEKPYDVQIPVIMISRQSGERILASITNNQEAYAQLVTKTVNYELEDGTSFSTPFVTGAIALIKSIDHTVTPSEIKNILTSTASKISVDSNFSGAGVLNIKAAIEQTKRLLN